MSRPRTLTRRLSELETLDVRGFQIELRRELHRQGRLVSLFATPGTDEHSVHLNALLATEAAHDSSGGLRLLRASHPRSASYPAMTLEFPLFQSFERELHESFGLRMHDHPWLKPLRGPAAAYPFFHLEGKETHEVGVGPIHAGVIEPGHFRFSCLGETVHHLEIQLGYQHRGVEALFRRSAEKPHCLGPLVETVAGDSTIAHATAFSLVLEELAGRAPQLEAELIRALALELERVAMHLGSLAGLCADLAFLPAASSYGRMRTAAINASMELCGSRFGRGWLRPGAVRFGVEPAQSARLSRTLTTLTSDLGLVTGLLKSSSLVARRLRGVGVVTPETTREMGFVGPAARASNVRIEPRADFAGPAYERFPITTVVERSGDCWARTRVRMRELDESIAWIQRVLNNHPRLAASQVDVTRLAPDSLSLALVEGWRGEVVYAVETDRHGHARAFRAQDPSLRNWFGLALAARGEGISDFPICNKSFDLSYCGHDL